MQNIWDHGPVALNFEHDIVSKERIHFTLYHRRQQVITDVRTLHEVRLGVHVLASLQGATVLDYRAYLHVSPLYPASSVHIVDTVGRGHTGTPEGQPTHTKT